MKKYIELSVIIPCYNVGEYIEECLDSIITQAFLPQEIILVDDGSTDDTAEKIQHYTHNYPNISYYYQTNQGVGEARNLGLSKAKSTFVQFLDPDDLINAHFYYFVSNLIQLSENVDLIYFGYQAFKNKTQIADNEMTSFVEIGTGTQLLDYLLQDNKYTGACWRYVFKKHLAINRFEGRVHEDHIFSLQLILAANNVYYLSDNAYYYRVRESSLSHCSKSVEYVDMFYSVVKTCLMLIKSSSITEDNKQRYRICMMTYYLSALFSCKQRKNDNFKLIYGCYELLYRTRILNKTGFIKNLFFIHKLSKKIKFSWSDRLKLIKYLYKAEYPASIYSFDANLILR